MRHVLSTLSFVLCGLSALLYSLLAFGFSLPRRFNMSNMTASSVNLNWFPPTSSWVTDLDTVLNGTGTYGYRFDGSAPPKHGQYSYCNMEHVRPDDYVVPNKKEFELVYVEVVRTMLLTFR